MSRRSAIVTFDHVEKRYGDGPLVIDDLSFTAQSGDFISLIGPSGCGKSTLLKLIAGLNPISAGKAGIDGAPLAATTAERAFVFQDPTLLPWLTARHNVELPLKLRGTPRAERSRIAAACLDLVGLTARAEYHPRQLSGGQKMRVSLARALSLSPRILLLDEPFGALDEMTRDRLNEELLAIRARKDWTAFFVTHSVAEAVFLSNRIFVMAANPGRLQREIAVDLPYPRTNDTRRSPAYLNLVAEVSGILRGVEDGAFAP